jgi:hypothetical protein
VHHLRHCPIAAGRNPERRQSGETGLFDLTQIWRTPRVLQLLGLAALFLVGFLAHSWPIFRPGAALSLYLDNTYTFHPLFHYVNQVFAAGELPLWVRGLLGGMPFYNTPQFSIFYPFYLFWKTDIYATPTDTIYNLSYLTYFHFLLLAINMVVFLRVAGVSWLGAILGSFVFSFSACMTVFMQHITIVASYCWMPLGLAAIHRINVGKGGIGAVGLAALAFSLVAMAAPSQSLIHVVLLAGLHTLAACMLLIQQGRRRELVDIFLRLAAAAALTLALVGPNVVTMALNQDEIRWLSAAGHMVGRGAVPYAAFLEDQSTVFELLNTLVPIRRNVAGDSFIGILVATLAILGAIYRWRSPFVKIYVVVAIYFLLSSTGEHLGLSLINYQIALINMIRQPSRNLVLFAFAVAYLVSVGFDQIARCLWEPNAARASQRISLVAGLLIAALALVALLTAHALEYRNSGALVAIGFGLLTLLVFIVVAPQVVKRWPVPRRVLALGLFAAVFFAWSMEQPRWPVRDIATNDYIDYDNLRMHAALKLIAEQPDHRRYRAKLVSDGPQPREVEVMRFAMNALWHDVRTFNSWFSPLPSYKAFTELTDFGNRPTEFYRRLGVRYVVCTRCTGSQADGLTLVGKAGGYSVYADEAAAPYYWIGRPQASASAAPAAANAAPPTMVSADSLAQLGDSYLRNPDCVPIIERHSHNVLRASIACKDPGLFVLNELIAPEWRLTLNGVAVLPIAVNDHLIGIPLNKGANLVELRYRPALYMFLLKVAAIAVIALIALWIWAAYQQIERVARRRGRTVWPGCSWLLQN